MAAQVLRLRAGCVGSTMAEHVSLLPTSPPIFAPPLRHTQRMVMEIVRAGSLCVAALVVALALSPLEGRASSTWLSARSRAAAAAPAARPVLLTSNDTFAAPRQAVSASSVSSLAVEASSGAPQATRPVAPAPELGADSPASAQAPTPPCAGSILGSCAPRDCGRLSDASREVPPAVNSQSDPDAPPAQPSAARRSLNLDGAWLLLSVLLLRVLL